MTSSYRRPGISFAHMGRALLTDLYELNMAASYLRRGMTQPATFSLFVRHLPRDWGFLVACGLNRCLEFLETFRFEDQDLAYLSETERYPDETLEAFRSLRFEGEVRAVPEGRLVFPDEPILEVTAPLPQAQLAETYLLNQITYQTAVCSKAARCRLAASERDLIDFSFRRVHGTEAALAVARATAIAGFVATSNVEAARVLGLPAAGTMAHSYIEAFGSEIEAFRAFAEDFPNRVILLVDTYDTARGVEKAIEVAGELAARGTRLLGIRLDSGDLTKLARAARRRLDESGLPDVQILVSGSLDEHAIAALAEAPIDAFGVGTRVGVAADAPYLDSVYKLVEFDGRPVAKLSTKKATLPGRKEVWRRSGMGGDVIALLHEDGPADAEPLLATVMANGQRLVDEGVEEPRNRFAEELRALPPPLRSLEPATYGVERSTALDELAEGVRSSIRHRELG
jgi:nicotinate phosphoribosyltransferase